MTYLESYIKDRIEIYKIQLHNINVEIEKCYSMKYYNKLQAQRKLYCALLQELEMIFELVKGN